MGEVKRYWYKPNIGFSVLDPKYYEDESGYVPYDDYAALEVERAEQWSFRRDAEAKVDTQAAIIAELQAENAKLRAELERRVPDGWKLVPVEPTPEMLDEIHLIEAFSRTALAARYAAMLAAAPSAPKADDPVKAQLLEALEAAEKKLCIAEYHLDKGEDDSVVFESEILAARAAIAAARKGEGE